MAIVLERIEKTRVFEPVDGVKLTVKAPTNQTALLYDELSRDPKAGVRFIVAQIVSVEGVEWSDGAAVRAKDLPLEILMQTIAFHAEWTTEIAKKEQAALEQKATD